MLPSVVSVEPVASAATQMRGVSSSCFLLFLLAQFAVKPREGLLTPGVSQRYDLPVQQIRRRSDNVWGSRLPRHVEINERNLQASNATGVLSDKPCHLTVSARLGNVDLKAHDTFLCLQ